MMSLTKTNDLLIGVALLVNRLALGAYFLLAGWGKVQGGVRAFVQTKFKPWQPEWLPDFLGSAYGYSIPFLEIIMGALLILGLLTRISAAVALAMVISFTIPIAIHVGLTKHGSGPFSANIIFMAILLLLAIVGGGAISLDAMWKGRSRA